MIRLFILDSHSHTKSTLVLHKSWVNISTSYVTIRFPRRDLSQEVSYIHKHFTEIAVMIKGKVKVKFTHEQTMKAERGSRGISSTFFNLVTRWGWVVKATPLLLYSQKRDPVFTVQEAGRSQCWSGQMWKISSHPEFDPQIIQPIVSRYTDYPIPAHSWLMCQLQCGTHQCYV